MSIQTHSVQFLRELNEVRFITDLEENFAKFSGNY